MKTNLRLFAVFAALAVRLSAAPLLSTTAVHTKPDEASPSITVVTAGTDPIAAPDSLASTPAGWMAIELPGPFAGYVQDKDLTKGLDMKPGTSIYLAPKLDAGVLATALKEDKTHITGQRGRWIQIRLERKLIGYIHIGGTAGYLPPIATTPAGSVAPAGQTYTNPPATAPASSAPVAPVAAGSGEVGHAAPVVAAADSTASLPRQFTGRLVSTRRPLRPRRPFDWALNDETDKHYAYIDTSKLLLDQPLEFLANRQITLYGSARCGADSKDIVIVAESLQVK